MVFVYILAFITIILLVPITFVCDFLGDTPVIFFRYAFIKYVPKYKTKKIKKDTAKEKTAVSKKSTLSKIKDTYRQVVDLVVSVSKGVLYVFKRIRIYADVNLNVSGKDVAETAIMYGAISAAAGNAYCMIDKYFNIKKQSIIITADYDGTETQIKGIVKCKIAPIFLLFGSVQALIGIVKNQMK